MKKSKGVKGFTLVELIVVIAIIGVLAAILVPNMMGYVSRAKFASMNSSAKTLYNAAMAACRENDVVHPIPAGTYGTGNNEGTVLYTYILEYFGSANNAVWAVEIRDESPVAACIRKTATDPFIGTFPNTNSEKKPSATTAQALAYAENGVW